jgi:hypothetical protein
VEEMEGLFVMRFDRESYLHGRCHIFALALHEVFGYKMELFWDTEAWFDDGETIDTALVHAYCIDSKGNLFDARGKVTRKLIEDDYEYNESEFSITTKSHLEKLMNQGVLGKPAKGELEFLKTYILNNKEKYKV